MANHQAVSTSKPVAHCRQLWSWLLVSCRHLRFWLPRWPTDTTTTKSYVYQQYPGFSLVVNLIVHLEVKERAFLGSHPLPLTSGHFARSRQIWLPLISGQHVISNGFQCESKWITPFLHTAYSETFIICPTVTKCSEYVHLLWRGWFNSHIDWALMHLGTERHVWFKDFKHSLIFFLTYKFIFCK